MSVTQYFIQAGQVIKNNNLNDKNYGLFSLNKWIKKMLGFYHVPFIDDCCDPADNRTLPMRYDSVALKIQYYNPTTNAWTNLTTF